MLRAARKWCVVTMLILSIGGHWAILQSFGWATMIVDFSKNDSLATAITKTFNGKNPCKVCKAVSQGKEMEKRSTELKPNLKLELFHEASNFVIQPPRVEDNEIPKPGFLLQPLFSPPTPPPRTV